MATTDLYKSVLWNDGEDITFGDLNDGQRFLASRLMDQVLGQLIGDPTTTDPEFVSQRGADPTTAWAYCLSLGGANPMQGSANNKVKIGAGTLLQKIAAANGNDAQLLPYTFDGTLEFTLANGDATNPRVDMIQMQLSLVTADVQSRDFKDATTGANSTSTLPKKWQVQANVSVKQGAPAASPVYPTPDPGYVPIACVVVGATYSGASALQYVDAAGAVAVLHDLRMPVSTKPHPVDVDTAGEVFNQTLDFLTSVDNPHGAPDQTHVRNFNEWIIAASTTPIYFALPFLKVGDVITNYTANVQKRTSNTDVITTDIVYYDPFLSSETSATGAPVTNNGNAPNWITMSPAAPLSITVVKNRAYYLKFTPGGSVTPNGNTLTMTVLSYRRPRAGAAANDTALQVICPTRAGRLVAIAATTTNGSHTANTTRLYAEQNNGAPVYLADVSSVAETGATPARHEQTMANIQTGAIFAAGPVVQGNGTHAPPIWVNGKRCYDASFALGSTAPSKLGVRFEYPTPGVGVYDVTFYVAEGL